MCLKFLKSYWISLHGLRLDKKIWWGYLRWVSSGPSVCNVKRRPSQGLCLRISRLDCSELFTRLQDNYTTWCALTGNRPEKKSMKAQDSWMCVDTCKFCFSWNPKPVGNRWNSCWEQSRGRGRTTLWSILEQGCKNATTYVAVSICCSDSVAARVSGSVSGEGPRGLGIAETCRATCYQELCLKLKQPMLCCHSCLFKFMGASWCMCTDAWCILMSLLYAFIYLTYFGYLQLCFHFPELLTYLLELALQQSAGFSWLYLIM